MGALNLIAKAKEGNPLMYQGDPYLWNKDTRMFDGPDNKRFSLDYAFSMAKELHHFSMGCDVALDCDYGVISTIDDGVIVDIKTEAHL